MKIYLLTLAALKVVCSRYLNEITAVSLRFDQITLML